MKAWLNIKDLLKQRGNVKGRPSREFINRLCVGQKMLARFRRNDETGKVPLQLLIELSNELNCNPYELFEFVDENGNKIPYPVEAGQNA